MPKYMELYQSFEWIWIRTLAFYSYEVEQVESKCHKFFKIYIIHTKKERKERKVAQSCLTLCDPMDCSPPGASIHGIFQARVLEWVAISFSRGSSPPRNRTQVSCIIGRRFTVWATREVYTHYLYIYIHTHTHTHTQGLRKNNNVKKETEKSKHTN